MKKNYRFLLCFPKYFDVVYSINPWMDPKNKVDIKKAQLQWSNLCSILKRLGAEIFVINQVKGLYDMVFSGDAGIVHKNTFIASNFKYKERQQESLYYQNWFKKNGFNVVQLPKDIIFEGMGDIIFYGDNAIFAYGIRSSKNFMSKIKELIPNLNLIAELELVNPYFFHLGYALSLLDKNTIMYVPDAFSQKSQEILDNLVPNVIKITEKEDIKNAVVNAIILDRNLIVHKCSQKTKDILKELSFNVIECDVSEFLKAGGSVRCLVLYL
jgi:N-dimethylarginine dimethylaminohydrolase